MIKEDKLAIYYRSKLAMVRDSKVNDVFDLAPNMRESDKKEIWKSHHKNAEEALLDGYMESTICLTVEYKERPIAMFGIVPHTLLSSKASVWLLASPDLMKIKGAFLKNSRKFIKYFLSYYRLLENFVDMQNMDSRRWLKWCGAEFGQISAYGVEKQPFQYFRFRRENYV